MNVAMDGGKLNICFVSDDIIGSAIKPYQTKGSSDINYVIVALI